MSAGLTIGRATLFRALTTIGAIAVVGVLIVRALPQSATLEPPLDLSRFRLVFADEFDRLSVSAHGPGTTWIAHTPWNGDFGDAAFSNPGPTGPFAVSDGLLQITASKDASGHWRSGLLSSEDATGGGFTQQYGYFEMRARLPEGKGLWPGFWLNTLLPKGSDEKGVEIDVVEHYGQFPGDFHATVHIWPKPTPDPDEASRTAVIPVEPGSLYMGFHTYGVDVEPDWITVYFDRRMRWRCPTPSEHRNKLMILVNLALGGGWPIDQAPNPAVMTVDYIRAYAPNGG